MKISVSLGKDEMSFSYFYVQLYKADSEDDRQQQSRSFHPANFAIEPIAAIGLRQVQAVIPHSPPAIAAPRQAAARFGEFCFAAGDRAIRESAVPLPLA